MKTTEQKLEEFFDELKRKSLNQYAVRKNSIMAPTPRQVLIAKERSAYAYACLLLRDKMSELDGDY